MKYCIGLLAIASCTTVPECPAPEPCGACPEVAVDYNDVAIEDAEQRLTACADRNQELKEEIRVLKGTKKRKGRK